MTTGPGTPPPPPGPGRTVVAGRPEPRWLVTSQRPDGWIKVDADTITRAAELAALYGDAQVQLVWDRRRIPLTASNHPHLAGEADGRLVASATPEAAVSHPPAAAADPGEVARTGTGRLPRTSGRSGGAS